jgi:hypothetical protein
MATSESTVHGHVEIHAEGESEARIEYESKLHFWFLSSQVRRDGQLARFMGCVVVEIGLA